MSLTKIAIHRPSLIIVIFSVLILGGIFSYKKLGYEMLPEFSKPTVTITTMYPGASPSEVENSVTKKIEDALSGVENVDEIISKSMENASLIILNFKNGTDLDLAMQDAQRKIDNVKKDLPDDVEPPSMSKVSPSDQPIMQLMATSSLPDKVFYQKMEDEIMPQIQQIKGVAETTLLGGEQREIRVNVNKDKLNFYNLSLLQVSQAVGKSNIEFPAGNLKTGSTETTIKLAGKFSSVEDIRNLVVHTPPKGSPIRLRDVADVTDGIKEQESVNRFNGQNGIGILLKKQSDANSVEVSKAVQERIQLVEKQYARDNVKFAISNDDSVTTLENVDAVLHDLMIAIILVAAVMLLFLHSLRNAFIVLVAIPTSLVTTFITMYAFGYSLNLMTLLAMSLVIGILVDDSIVVLENIQRYLEKGRNRIDAAIEGRQEIGFAALSITMVDVVVFLPVTFLNVTVADILRQFSVVVVVATLTSLFVCFTLTPWLASRLGKVEHLNPKNLFHRFLIGFEKMLDRYTAWYGNILDWCLGHKAVTLAGIAMLFVATGLTMRMGILGSELVAQGDQGKFMMKLEFPKNASLATNNYTSRQVEDYLLGLPDVESVFANVGGPSTGVNSTGLGDAFKTELTVKRNPGDAEKLHTEKYMMQVRKEVEQQFPGVEVTCSNIGIVNSGGAPIEVVLTGDDYDKVLSEGNRLKEILLNTPGANDVNLSVEDGKPELQVENDREKMARLGLDMSTVGLTLRDAYSGNDDSKYREDGTEYDIRVMLDAFDRTKADDLLDLTFTNTQGEPVKLRQFATVEAGMGPSMLERKNRRSAVTLTSYNIGRGAGTVAEEFEKSLAAAPLAEGVEMSWGGDIKSQHESFGALGMAFGAALVLVYLIMVALYNNFIYPLVVLFSIPVALIGALLALNLSMSNLSVFTLLGIIMLLGLVAKNAILIVDMTNQLKAEGLHYLEALKKATRERMRPILMTTVAMVIGMIPIAIAKGAAAEWKNGLGWVLIGGLLSSMFLTIILVPVIYAIVDGVKERFTNKEKQAVVLA
ncbi:MAG: efflux RND transporter permease subunit [Lewinellaceae bacterium]|nr:efflux RND transporter permease subunit [Lewinellaceae bacterium]